MSSRFAPRAPAKPSYVLSAAANGVAAVIEELGGDPDQVFGSAGVEPETLDDPLTEIALRSYCRLLEEAAAHTQHDNFGLAFGRDFVPPRLGAIGYLTISAPTMASAIRSLCAYFPAHQRQTVLEVRSAWDALAIVYEVLDESIQRRQDAEFSIAVFWHMFRHCLGPDWAPLEVSFSHPEPGERRQHEDLFNAPVYFNRPTNCFVFRQSDLDHVMPTQDPLLYEIMLGLLRDRRPATVPDDADPVGVDARALFVPDAELVDRVQELVTQQLPAGGPSLEDTARMLFMSSATLYRRLKDLDVSFHELVRAVRRELALCYMRDHTLSLTDIAMLLGYSELSAFSRAFRQWSGMAPARYRRRLQA